MTDYSDKNKQIRAKNLFEEETPETDGKQEAATDKTVEGIQSGVKGKHNLGKTGGAKKMGKPVRPGAGKEKNTGKKSPRQRQQAHRLYACAVMALFVVFVVGWGICQLVRSINEGESEKMLVPQPGEQVVDNSANAGKTIDVDELINQVLDRVTFEAELNLLEDSVASGMIDTAEGTDLRIYMGNGTYSDELVVMTALNEKDAQQNQKNAENHLAEMQKQFSDYIPKEAKKIDNAVKVRCGSYVVLCVTNDTETAKKTIDTFLKNKE